MVPGAHFLPTSEQLVPLGGSIAGALKFLGSLPYSLHPVSNLPIGVNISREWRNLIFVP